MGYFLTWLSISVISSGSLDVVPTVVDSHIPLDVEELPSEFVYLIQLYVVASGLGKTSMFPFPKTTRAEVVKFGCIAEGARLLTTNRPNILARLGRISTRVKATLLADRPKMPVRLSASTLRWGRFVDMAKAAGE